MFLSCQERKVCIPLTKFLKRKQRNQINEKGNMNEFMNYLFIYL